MIELKNLTKTYKDCVALKDVEFVIETGEFAVITGRSGSGKSTLLKCMGGFLQPTDGQVLIDGVDICSLSDRQKSKLRNEKIGFIFQSYALEPKYTAYENIELPLIIRGEKSGLRKKRVKQVAEFVGVSALLKKSAESLSGGERQRVAIARALANNPEIIFADEPCGNLDKQNALAVIKLLRKINLGGATVVMVTHQPQDIDFACRKIELLDGTVNL